MRKSLSTSVALGTLFLSAGHSAFAADADILAKLQAQINALQQQVNHLQQGSLSGEALPEVVFSEEGIVGEEDNSKIIATKADVDGVQAALESYKYDQDRQRERQTVKSARDTTLFGAVQTRIQQTSIPTNSGNSNTWEERKLNFEVPLAQIGLRGNLYRDYKSGKNLSYQLSFGYSKRAGSTTSDFSLQDAYLQYSFAPTNGGLEDPKLTLTVGQQQVPFGQEAQAPEDLRPTITQARAVSQLGLSTRQIGLVLRGDIKPYTDYAANYRAPLLEYAFGIANGNGPNRNDDNNKKDYIGRVAFTLPVDYASIFRELKFGASYKKGTSNITAGTPVRLITDNGKNDVLGLDIYYNHAPFGVTYEYYKATRDTWVPGKASTQEVKSDGQTITLFYTVGDQFYNSIKTSAKFDDFWPKSVQAYYRFDTYDPDTATKNALNEVDIHSVGLNFFFAQTTKFQLGVNRWSFANVNQKNYTELLAQFQYGF
ncbi:DUF3138 domain-containing protein [Acinetobacter sp. ANC 4558]|nr:DUF3138 domain-containing protein [Acinetobacter sp. ANC 4558]OTG84219.1 DUF3138 domain-containing protein [Acinetobacter sp. ANC 4558]